MSFRAILCFELALFASLFSIGELQAKDSQSRWDVRRVQEPVTRFPRVLAFNSNSSPQGSTIRIACNRQGPDVGFIIPYAFKKLEQVRAVLRIDDFAISASQGSGLSDTQIVIIPLSRISFERIMGASRVDVQLALPNRNVIQYSYLISGTAVATEPLRKECPPEKLEVKTPVTIEEKQISKYLNGDLNIDSEKRELVDAKVTNPVSQPTETKSAEEKK